MTRLERDNLELLFDRFVDGKYVVEPKAYQALYDWKELNGEDVFHRNDKKECYAIVEGMFMGYTVREG